MILDDLDRMILRALVANADQSTTQLAARLGLSQPATWRRIKRLQEAGVIAGRNRVYYRTSGYFASVYETTSAVRTHDYQIRKLQPPGRC